MGQRPRNQQPYVEGQRDYKYQGNKDENIRPHEQCEMEQDRHRVEVPHWPPVPKGNQAGDPYIDARCIDCGAWLQVYEKHATKEMHGIEVILPKPDAPAPIRGPKIGRPRAVQVA